MSQNRSAFIVDKDQANLKLDSTPVLLNAPCQAAGVIAVNQNILLNHAGGIGHTGRCNIIIGISTGD